MNEGSKLETLCNRGCDGQHAQRGWRAQRLLSQLVLLWVPACAVPQLEGAELGTTGADGGASWQAEVVRDPGVAYVPDDSEAKALSATRARAETALAQTPKDSRGLPLWESRPNAGARVAIYVDFDGGKYAGTTYSGIDLDGQRNRFGREEQLAIIRAAMELAEGYAGFDINVTTSDEARKKSSKWAWILVTDDEGSSGEAYIDSVGTREQARGYAGSRAVFNPSNSQRGYLLVHEVGHMFGLRHSGLYKGGRWYEWSELEQSRTGGWMGGRNSHFQQYEWKRSNIEDRGANHWQDPAQIIRRVAGLANGGDSGGSGGSGDSGDCHDAPLNDSDYCSRDCPCDEGEGDCDKDAHCAGNLICQQRSGTDICVQPPADCHAGQPGSKRYCSESCPCDRGEGDCDSDSECKAGLYCRQQRGTDYCRKRR